MNCFVHTFLALCLANPLPEKMDPDHFLQYFPQHYSQELWDVANRLSKVVLWTGAYYRRDLVIPHSVELARDIIPLARNKISTLLKTNTSENDVH